jgi:hypothetical protein
VRFVCVICVGLACAGQETDHRKERIVRESGFHSTGTGYFLHRPTAALERFIRACHTIGRAMVVGTILAAAPRAGLDRSDVPFIAELEWRTSTRRRRVAPVERR